HLADIAGDHRVHMILADGTLEGAHRFGRGRMIVVGDDLDLASVDAAGGVDLVGGELRAHRDGRAGHGLRLGDHADADRPFRLRLRDRADRQGEEGRTSQERRFKDGGAREAQLRQLHCISSETYFCRQVTVICNERQDCAGRTGLIFPAVRALCKRSRGLESAFRPAPAPARPRYPARLLISIYPNPSIIASKRGLTTVEVSSSTMTAGPAIAAPGARSLR